MANVVKGQPKPTTFRVSKFLREVRAEMRKVVWPNRKELTTYTIVVIVATVIAGMFLGGVDLIFSQIVALLSRF